MIIACQVLDIISKFHILSNSDYIQAMSFRPTRRNLILLFFNSLRPLRVGRKERKRRHSEQAGASRASINDDFILYSQGLDFSAPLHFGRNDQNLIDCKQHLVTSSVVEKSNPIYTLPK